jgi:hypothetical protein
MVPQQPETQLQISDIASSPANHKADLWEVGQLELDITFDKDGQDYLQKCHDPDQLLGLPDRYTEIEWHRDSLPFDKGLLGSLYRLQNRTSNKKVKEIRALKTVLKRHANLGSEDEAWKPELTALVKFSSLTVSV